MPGKFSYDPKKLGVTRWLGRATRLQEMSVQQFDELRQATLSEKLDPQSTITYLEVGNLSTPGAMNRSTFMAPDTTSVSKLSRFWQAVDKLGLEVKEQNDPAFLAMVLEWEEGEREAGKYGKQKYLEPIRIPSPDEIAGLPAPEAEAPAAAAAVTAAPAANYLPNLIMGCADGLTMEGLKAELEGMGVKEDWEKQVKPVVTELIAKGSLRRKGGKLEAV